MSESSKPPLPASGGSEPALPRRVRRRRPRPEALDVAGGGLLWGGWLGFLWDLVTLRRVRRRIRESRARRGNRVREAAAARRES